MDYDDIDYDEGYSIRDIDNDWFNGNMDHETVRFPDKLLLINNNILQVSIDKLT